MAAAWKRLCSTAVFPPSGCQLRHSKKQTCWPPTGRRGGAIARTPKREDAQESNAFRLGAFTPKAGRSKTAGFSGALMGRQEAKLLHGQDMWFSFCSRSANNSQNKTSVPFEEGQNIAVAVFSSSSVLRAATKKGKKSGKTSSVFEWTLLLLPLPLGSGLPGCPTW